jgi:hypothetical protein
MISNAVTDETGLPSVPMSIPTKHSEDGAWCWSGSEWLPARSPDGKWWFDGQVWRRARRRFDFGRVDKACAVVWLVWFGVAVVAAEVLGPHVTVADGLTGGWLVCGAVVVLVWLLGMVVTGFVLARRMRRASLLASVVLVWLLMGFWVAIVAAIPTPATQPGDDDGAAVGLMMMAVPAFLVLALLAAVGAAAAWSVRRVSRRLRQS